MKRGIISLIVIIALSVNIGVVSSQQDYLEVTDFKIIPTQEVESGDLVNAEITLERVGIIPRNATLNITLNLVNSIVDLSVDDINKSYANKDEIVYPLPEEGVKKIYVTVSGKAQEVEKRVKRDIVNVKTYVFYDEDHKGFEEEITLPLFITNPNLEKAVDAINDAKRKMQDAENRIYDLDSLGADTTGLRNKLENARDVLRSAENYYDLGRPIDAKNEADIAINLFEDIISSADELKESVEQKSAITRYALIGVGVVVAIIILLFVVRGRREELG